VSVIYTRDPDFTLLNCDVLLALCALPDEFVHCVVTSPPYWGLRDYGTGAWDGGDIIWAKPNPMPESVTDRPTKSHEYVFLLTKSPRYYFDQEAVREPAEYGYQMGRSRWVSGGENGDGHRSGGTGSAVRNPETGRNVRSVWEIATQPYPDAHFAT
jgi:DNA methylase